VPPVSLKSRTTQCGRVLKIPATASAGDSASPTTLTSSISSSSSIKRARIDGASSTTKTFNAVRVDSMAPLSAAVARGAIGAG